MVIGKYATCDEKELHNGLEGEIYHELESDKESFPAFAFSAQCPFSRRSNTRIPDPSSVHQRSHFLLIQKFEERDFDFESDGNEVKEPNDERLPKKTKNKKAICNGRIGSKEKVFVLLGLPNLSSYFILIDMLTWMWTRLLFEIWTTETQPCSGYERTFQDRP
uniref:Uncharacterized protein n=1 Tax=Cucumis melo TaxID=3656 RepID=A0A9I9E6J8_CUCME